MKKFVLAASMLAAIGLSSPTIASDHHLAPGFPGVITIPDVSVGFTNCLFGVRYRVFSRPTRAELQDLVTDKLNKGLGWIPVGGVTTRSNPHNEGDVGPVIRWGQAMVRCEDDPFGPVIDD